MQVFGLHAGGAVAQPMPLVVDVDGALLRVGPCAALLRAGMRQHPRLTLRLLARHRGFGDRAALALAAARPAMPVALQVNPDMLDLIAMQRRCGAAVVLVGAAPLTLVGGVADALGIDAVAHGADPGMAFPADRRALAMASIFGRGGFVYAGGRACQAPLAAAAARALMVGMGESLRAPVRREGGSVRVLAMPSWRVVTLPAGAVAGLGRSHAASLLRLSRMAWGLPPDDAAPTAPAMPAATVPASEAAKTPAKAARDAARRAGGG